MIICFEKYRRQNKALVLGSDRMCTVLKKIRNKSAIELLEEYGLDKTVPIDIEQLLRAIGISAIGKDFSELEKRLGKPKGSILGMLLSSGNNAAIFYRKDDSYNRRRFTIAHELAHAINHSDNEPHIEYRMAEKEMEEAFEFVVKSMVIIKDLYQGNPNLPEGREEEAIGFNAIAGGFQGQRQWTDNFPNTDFAEALLNSSFDWEGAREPFVTATENDSLNGATMLFNKLLTNTAQIFADVRTYWSAEAVKRVTGYELEGKAKEAGGFIHLINSGAACLDACGKAVDKDGNPCIKPFWEMTEKDVDECLKATTWCAADNGYFRGGGFSSRFVTEAAMPVTMARLNIVKGVGPVLQLVEGWTVRLPDEVTDTLWKRTDYTWPCTWFTPRVGEGPFKSAYDVMNNWGANHGAISYGHIGADLITLCSILRIPVCMHNVPEDKIFRPACWNAYGMDKEGQDYRACKAYGPMYK